MKSIVVNQTECYAGVHRDDQCRPARRNAEEDQDGADAVGEKRKRQTGNRPDVNGVRKMRGHTRKAGDLFPAVAPEQAEANHEPQ